MAAAGRTSTRRRAGQRSSARSRVSRAPSRVACGTRPQPGRPARGDRRSRPPARVVDPDRAEAPQRRRRRSGRAQCSRPPPRALTTSGSSPLARSSSSTPSRRGGASSSSMKLATPVGDRAPTNSDTTRPSRYAFTAGMPCTRCWAERPGFASTSTFASSTAPARLSTSRSSTGVSARRPTPGCPEVDDHGDVRERSTTSRSKVSSVTSAAMFRNNVERVPDHPLERRCCSPRSKRPGCHRARYPRAQDVRGRSRRRANSRPSASAPRLGAEPVELLGREDPRRPVCRRAMPSSSRSSSNGSIRTFESLPMQSGIPRARIRSAGRKPSPRSASVVGHAQMVAPVEARRSSSVRRRASRGLPSSACRGSRCGRAARSDDSHARRGIPRSPSAARPRARGEAAALPPRSARSRRATRRGTRARSGGERHAAAARSSSTWRRYASTDSWRNRGGRRGRTQRAEHDLDASGGRSLHSCECLRQAEVVELADCGEARVAHLAIRRFVAPPHELGRLTLRLGEHGVAPRPEVTGRSTPAQRSLEGVAMGVHESRQLERTSHGGDATSEISFMGARERSGREAGAFRPLRDCDPRERIPVCARRRVRP